MSVQRWWQKWASHTRGQPARGRPSGVLAPGPAILRGLGVVACQATAAQVLLGVGSVVRQRHHMVALPPRAVREQVPPERAAAVLASAVRMQVAPRSVPRVLRIPVARSPRLARSSALLLGEGVRRTVVRTSGERAADHAPPGPDAAALVLGAPRSAVLGRATADLTRALDPTTHSLFSRLSRVCVQHIPPVPLATWSHPSMAHTLARCACCLAT